MVNALHVHHVLHAVAVAKVKLLLKKYDVLATSQKPKAARHAVNVHHAHHVLHVAAVVNNSI